MIPLDPHQRRAVEMSVFFKVFICALILAAQTMAQTSLGAGAIEGNVRDSSGGAIANASMEVKSVATGATRSTFTDPSGRYTFLSLPVGEYEVKAEARGFRTTVRSGLTLQIDRTALVDFELSVGQVTETVSVTGAAPLIETSQAALGDVIENKQILDLPLNGRSYAQLALLAPGVVAGGSGIGTQTQSNNIGTAG